MPVLIVSKHQASGKALEDCLVAGGMLALRADSPEAALSLANVLRFKVAVFVGEVDEKAAATMQELHTRHGTRGVSVVEKRSGATADALSGKFDRSLVGGVSDAKVIECIRELRQSKLDA